MRRLALTLAVLAVVGLAASTAFAGHRYRGYGGGHGRDSYGYYGRHSGYGSYSPYGQHYGYGYSSRYQGSGYQSSPFLQALRRVQAKHSRSRYNPHPRSLYTSPPVSYGYRGW